MTKATSALASNVRRVEPDNPDADRHDRPVAQEPLESSPRENGDDVSPAHAPSEEGALQRLDPHAGLGPRDRAPPVLALLEIGGGRPALVERIAPEGGSRARMEWEFGRRRRRGRG